MALEVVSKRVIGSQLWILKKSIMAIVLGVDQSKVRLAGEGEKQKHGNTERKALPVG